ncbi:MAG TPA: hypothetical protein VKX17_17130 [Planctomycetota bacterium]|nr:hypothetical protein [Planctomycetota bacterium]
MNSPPRRARFQIHLSTAIVLMFVAGVLIWANLEVRYVHPYSKECGWPLPFMTKSPPPGPWAIGPTVETDTLGYVVDFACSIAILVAVYLLLEWLIRRARFQIHLSTAIVLMFVAGALMWANTRARLAGYWETSWFYNKDQKEHVYKIWVYGFPLAARRELEKDFSGEQHSELLGTGEEWRETPIAVDLLVCVVLLFAVWFFCEWLISRPAVRKGA